MKPKIQTRRGAALRQAYAAGRSALEWSRNHDQKLLLLQAEIGCAKRMVARVMADPAFPAGLSAQAFAINLELLSLQEKLQRAITGAGASRTGLQPGEQSRGSQTPADGARSSSGPSAVTLAAASTHRRSSRPGTAVTAGGPGADVRQGAAAILKNNARGGTPQP